MSLNLPHKIIVSMPFGSHLYGTQTENSDLDFKGVILPLKKEVLLGKIPPRIGDRRTKQPGEKNLPGEQDEEYFLIHEFIRLALEGQTMALDMLHALPSNWLKWDSTWEELYENRQRFHTRSLNAFVGYAKRQAAKYGIKGSRIATCKFILDFLKSRPGVKVYEVEKELLASGEPHISPTDDPTAPVEILGKRLSKGASLDVYVLSFEKYLTSYGERAKQAERDEGVDWKAMSHAIRAAEEVRRILIFGDFSLPFETEFSEHLRNVKVGSLRFDAVRQELEDRVAALEILADNSDLPHLPDRAWSIEFLERTTMRVFRDDHKDPGIPLAT